jgi:hypothetical protein
MALNNSNIQATTRTSDGSIYASRARVKGIFCTSASGGSIVLKDGGSGGTTLLNVAIAANFNNNIIIPQDGILFETSVYLDLTGAESVTVFYQA